MKVINKGVSECLENKAREYAVQHMPVDGYCGNNPDAPVFRHAEAWVEVKPYKDGFQVTVLQKGARYDTTSPSGRYKYGANFIFLDEYVSF